MELFERIMVAALAVIVTGIGTLALLGLVG